MKFKIDIKDKYIKSKNSIRKASASTSDMKDITGDLITKSRNLLNSLISQNNREGDIFHSFKISKNKALIAAAAYFLGDSYKFSKENHNNKLIPCREKFLEKPGAGRRKFEQISHEGT